MAYFVDKFFSSAENLESIGSAGSTKCAISALGFLVSGNF